MKLNWKRTLTLESKDLVGIDVGSACVKAVQLRRTAQGYNVVAAGACEIEHPDKNAAEPGDSRVEAVRRCVADAGVQTSLAVCALSGPEVAVRNFSFPQLPAEEVPGAVLLEAGQVCPFSIDSCAVDYNTVSSDEGICGILVAATNEAIERRKQIVEAAALKCVLMDVDGLALLNCFSGFSGNGKDGSSAEKTTAILNVGHSTATLAMLGEDGLPFVRDIPIGGRNIVENAMRHSNFTAEQVREMIHHPDDDQLKDPQRSELLAAGSSELINDVSETLRFYSARGKSAVVRTLYVCGGFALVKGFVELLDSRLPPQVVLWNPFEQPRCSAGRSVKQFLSQHGPALAVAGGLAVRSI